jgi:hypothetical protein
MGDVKNETAFEKLENHFGKEFLTKLVSDNTSRLDRTVSSGLLKFDQIRTIKESGQELDLKKRQQLDEYASIEAKQAKLLVLLASSVYAKLKEENENGQRFIDAEELKQVFFPALELEKLAVFVHEQASKEIKKRIDSPEEWEQKPYAGDILTKYYQYYKIYKGVLEKYPTCQVALSKCLEKKNFAAQLKKVLVSFC